jgi:hypothetical protein
MDGADRLRGILARFNDTQLLCPDRLRTLRSLGPEAGDGEHEVTLTTFEIVGEAAHRKLEPRVVDLRYGPGFTQKDLLSAVIMTDGIKLTWDAAFGLGCGDDSWPAYWDALSEKFGGEKSAQCGRRSLKDALGQ